MRSKHEILREIKRMEKTNRKFAISEGKEKVFHLSKGILLGLTWALGENKKVKKKRKKFKTMQDVKDYLGKVSEKAVKQHLCKKCGKVIVNSLSTSYMGAKFGRCNC